MTLNLDLAWKNEKSIFNNNSLLPPSIRGLIIGSSGSGKTHLLFNMLLQPDFLDYNKLYIFSNSLQQPEYQLLIKGFQNNLDKTHIIGIFRNQKDFKGWSIQEICEYVSEKLPEIDKGNITISAFKSTKDVPDPSELDLLEKNTKNSVLNKIKKPKRLMIFDDCINQKQNIIEDYYTRGRHNATQCFYISQVFIKIPKGTVRDNANFFILFELNDLDVENIHRQYVSKDMDIKDFKRFCNIVWKEKYAFVVIDRFNDDINFKYRKGFEIPFSNIIK